MLPIAASTYHTHAAIARDPDLASDRAKRDAELRPEVQRVFDDNFQVYGVRKVWRQMQREGFEVARCTVARLMKQLEIQGVIRGKPIKTTFSNKATPCLRDHVNRKFSVPAPNMLWLSDFTFVSTWQGFAYVAVGIYLLYAGRDLILFTACALMFSKKKSFLYNFDFAQE